MNCSDELQPGSEISNISTCPINKPKLGSNNTCGFQYIRCSYGEQCCCGQCYSSMVFECDATNNQQVGSYTDACLGYDDCGDVDQHDAPISNNPTCPLTSPDIGYSTCGFQKLRCAYEEECCCGTCYDSTVLVECKGTNEKWLAYYTDACMDSSTCATNMNVRNGNLAEPQYKLIFGLALLICFIFFIWNGTEEWR